MIYTVTFNPALDYVVNVPNINLGETNRSNKEHILAGGKGLNVSTVLSHLHMDNIALGFIAGFTGLEIERLFNETGGRSNFIHLKTGNSRINVKLKGQQETEINASGPVIDHLSLQKLFSQIDSLQDGDMLVLAGSIPSSLPQTIYQDILAYISNKKIDFVIDATNDLLLNTLTYKPFLIKPNLHELEEMFGVTIQHREDIVSYAKQLQDRGARNVLVSLGGDGAILLCENHTVLDCQAPKGKVLNSVGAGDSMVAGFITGWYQTKDYHHAFHMGLAAGSASAFSETLATKEQIDMLYHKKGEV